MVYIFFIKVKAIPHIYSIFFLFSVFFLELGTEPRALRLLSKRSTTEVNPQPLYSIFYNLLTILKNTYKHIKYTFYVLIMSQHGCPSTLLYGYTVLYQINLLSADIHSPEPPSLSCFALKYKKSQLLISWRARLERLCVYSLSK